MPKKGGTKAELQQQIEELQQKLKEARAVAKEQDDRGELEEATLREELEISQEQAAQECAEQERLCKVVETAEAEVADLREDLDQAHWDLEECRRDMELNVARAKDSVREEMKGRHSKELAMKDEIITLLKEKLSTKKGSSGPSLGGGSSNSKPVEVDKDPPQAVEERTTSKKMTLSTLPKFNGDGDAFDRWLCKFSHYLEQWTERQKLLQLELYLSGRAQQVYKVLPTSAKDTFSKAVESLKKRLQPVANEALLSTQLMKRKQKARESVSIYAQELKALFEKSYGKRQGMDLASKELLKRDLFVQGLSLKWQEKVLPSAATLADALHQAQAAEEQDTLLGELHCGRPPDKLPPHRPSSQSHSIASGETERESDSRMPEIRRGVRPKRCHICHSTQHRAYECPQRNAPLESSGRDYSR